MSYTDEPALFTAGHALHYEEMTRFSAQLDWLQDPSIVDESVLGKAAESDDVVIRTAALGSWMVRQFGVWSYANHRQLSWLKTFNDHDLSDRERELIWNEFENRAYAAYSPGVYAMAEIFSVVPMVADREGASRSDWFDVASRAKRFGSLIARDGTDTQLLIRHYLSFDTPKEVSIKILNPALFELDDQTGITTVTPIDALVAGAKLLARYFETSSAPCAALQVKSPVPAHTNMFDAVWAAYAAIADRIIYPHIALPQETVEQQDPDPYFFENLSLGMVPILEIMLAELERQGDRNAPALRQALRALK